MTQNPLSHSPTPSSFKNRHNHRQRIDRLALTTSCFTFIAVPFDAQELGRKLVHHLNRGRLLCFHLRFLVLLALPSLYFLVSYPRRFLVLNLLALLAFLLTLLVSLNLALPRLPSIRLLLARSLPAKFTRLGSSSVSSKAVVWSIGSKPKSEKKANSGTWVQVYSNGDVYEGEFHKGKCSGSGVYYYHMKGRYEGDWVDGRYDGYGVETWAKGSRYRGQYRQGLRHGIGVYRFYTGDVYAGEWSNGQCHGCGVHACEDGSKYVGEFKCGVKHGLGHYHFRNGDEYFGEYFSDKMHGFGVYQFGNGHRYEGAWHMKEEGRDLVHTLTEMVRHNPVTGKMVLSMFLAHKILDPEFFTLSRKHGEPLRKLVKLQRLTRECIKLCQLQTKQPMLPEWWLLKLSRNKCIIITVKKYQPCSLNLIQGM